MINSGVIGMPLHFGRMPGWFTDRMGLLGSAVIESVIQNYGKSELLSRMSDPAWFRVDAGPRTACAPETSGGPSQR